MNVVVNIITLGMSVFLLAVPLINRYVFHTPNIDAIVIAGREAIDKIQELQRDQKFDESRDSCRALINRYRNDSLTIFTSDITDWNLVGGILADDTAVPRANLIRDELDEEEIADLAGAGVPTAVRFKIVKALNYFVAADRFYLDLQDSIPLAAIRELTEQLDALANAGIFIRESGRYGLKEKISKEEKERLMRFHVLVLEKAVFPSFLKKDMRRGKDWASEFIVQTALYNIGLSYKAQFQLDEAVSTWSSLIDLYSKSVYAEVLFLQIGQSLFADGKAEQADGRTGIAETRFRDAIHYLGKLEQNREIAEEFPKYQYVDLKPGTYVNIDMASRAKTQVKEKTTIYTSKKAEAELSGKTGEDRSGYFLEDAIKLIGECYIQLGKTDSARAQFGLLLDFFPESDNLDNAQKLIADSYMKDGDLIVAAADSSDAQARHNAEEAYRRAVREYLKFTNIYPQSELISETYIALGDAYNKLGLAEDAASAFRSALGRAKEAEGQARVQLQIGNYFFERRRINEAIDAYQIILNNFLSTEVASNAQYMLGECHEAKGDTVEAIKNYEVILEHYKQSSFMGGAAFKIGDYYFKRGNYKEARRAYGMGYTYDREGNLAAKTKFQMGMIWMEIAREVDGAEREKAFSEAINEMRIVVREFEGSEEADQASYQIAYCYTEMGREDAAREAVKKISNRDLLIKSVKLFGIGTENHEEEVVYWEKAFASALEDEERATALYEKGMVLLDKMKHFQDALDAFSQSHELTRKTSKKINAAIGVARAHVSLNQFAEAESLYTELVANPRVTEEQRQQLRIQLYDTYLKAKKIENAYEGFENFSMQFPLHALTPYALYRMGAILSEQRKYEAAMEKFQVILDKYAESPYMDKAVLSFGEQKINLGKVQEGLQYLLDFIGKNPEVASAVNFYMKIAETYAEKLNNKEKAIETYGIVVDDYRDDPLLSYAAYRQGMLLKELDRERKAVDVFEKVRKEDKAIYRAAQSEIGKIIAKTDPEKAIENYGKIVEECETAEDSAIAMIGIGDVYVTVKKWGQAAEMYEKVYTGYTGNDTSLTTGALVKRADALINGQKYNEAIAASREMQKRFPEHKLTINTYYFESSALFSLKRFAEARKAMQRIIDLDKSEQLTEIACYQIGDSYYFTKEFRAAVAKYEDYIRRYPNGKFVPRALYMQANSYISLPDPEFNKSREKLLRLVAHHPDFDEICMAKNYLAYSLNRLDDFRSALKYYNEVINNKQCDRNALEFAREQREAIRASRM